MGGQAEQLGAAKGTPLEVTVEHSGPCNAIGDAQRCGPLHQGGLPAHLIGASDHQLQSWVAGGDRRKRLDQQIHPLLGMDAAEEQQDALAMQLGEAVKESLELALGIGRGGGGAVADHHLVGLVQPERLAGQQPLLLGGEQHGPGIAQHPVVGPGPVAPLLEVPEGIGALEPGIEHPVGIYEVGDAAAMQGAPGGISVVLPDALNDHHIVLLGQGADAGGQAAAVAIAAGNRAEADGLEGLILQPGGIGWIEAGHGGGHAQGRQVGRDLAHSLHRAAAGGVERADQSKQLHGLGTRLVPLDRMI